LKQKNKSWCKYTLEKTKGVIKNGQSRDTGSIGHTRHAQVEGNKTQQKTQKTRKMINTNINDINMTYDMSQPTNN